MRNAVIAMICALVLVACGGNEQRETVDKLNDRAYYLHYRNVDSTEILAAKALSLAANYDDGRAEAMNNLAFAAMARMEYDIADSLLNEAYMGTANSVERLVAAVQQMRLCQRRSQNREFYEFRQQATDCLNRINEDYGKLPDRLKRRVNYAKTEYAIVTSTYYYYVGLKEESIKALNEIDPNGEIRRDTAQLLNYLYNVGAGGIIQGTPETVFKEETEALEECLRLARRSGCIYFEANALEALAEHEAPLNPPLREEAEIRNPNPENQKSTPDSRQPTASELAYKARELFKTYGDVYQIAGAERTLASCCMANGDYEAALRHLEQSLEDCQIDYAPDLVASIREQLSVVYAALGNKQMSDYNRNLYLDLQENTRQDRQMEARADVYRRNAVTLNIMIGAVLVLIALLLFLLWLFYYLSHSSKKNGVIRMLGKWLEEHRQRKEALLEQLEEIKERQNIAAIELATNQRRNIDSRAKVSLAMSITPLIDRMRHEIRMLVERNEADDVRKERYDYIKELIDTINRYNDVLTTWIQLQRGQLSLHIETFALQPLFDIIQHSRTAFSMKGITLNVGATEAKVKADKALTLFMINTLADNARKSTEAGGSVNVEAVEKDEYVEISVSDTGCGMDEEQLATLFNHNISNGHGFGLLNCKGIIEKYKKFSRIFSICEIKAESQKGQGSRFSFRLPRSLKMVLAISMMSLFSTMSILSITSTPQSSKLNEAYAFADSAYYSNIAGTFEKTIAFSDSCFAAIAECSRIENRKPKTENREPKIDNQNPLLTDILIDIHNETAVAALALNDWQMYNAHNKEYIRLFNERAADKGLAEYCRAMKQSQSNKYIAIALLVMLLIAIIPAYYFLYYRHRIRQQRDIMAKAEAEENALRQRIEAETDELNRLELESGQLHVSNSVLDNCLSTIKHETMYYPGRLLQLAKEGDPSLNDIREMADFYRDVYGILLQQAQKEADSRPLKILSIRLDDEISLLATPDLLDYMAELTSQGAKAMTTKAPMQGVGSREQGAESREQGIGSRWQVEFETVSNDDAYVTLKKTWMLNPDVTFEPSEDSIPLFVCRQIVREWSQATNLRRCGINIKRDETGVYLEITLPKKINE